MNLLLPAGGEPVTIKPIPPEGPRSEAREDEFRF
jgi:hypothetical protein